MKTSELCQRMHNSIASTCESITTTTVASIDVLEYLIPPLDATLHLDLCHDVDLTKPQQRVRLSMPRVELRLEQRQYRDAVKLADDFSKVQLKSKV